MQTTDCRGPWWVRESPKTYDRGQLSGWTEVEPHVFDVTSFRSAGNGKEPKTYRVDTAHETCTCPQWKKLLDQAGDDPFARPRCKHLEALRAIDQGADLSFSRLQDELLLRYKDDVKKRVLIHSAIELRTRRIAAANGIPVSEVKGRYVEGW